MGSGRFDVAFTSDQHGGMSSRTSATVKIPKRVRPSGEHYHCELSAQWGSGKFQM